MAKFPEIGQFFRNSEKFNFLLNLFLWFRINYSRNWECFDQSCVNRPETVHGTLRFLYLSHLLYGIWVKIFPMNRYISKSYTTSRQYTEQGQLQCQLLLVYFCIKRWHSDSGPCLNLQELFGVLYSIRSIRSGWTETIPEQFSRCKKQPNLK